MKINLTLNWQKKTTVEKIIFKQNNYFLTRLKINPKIEKDLTKWPDYEKINNFSDEINEIKKIDLIRLDLSLEIRDIYVGNEILLFENKKIKDNQITFQNF